MSLRVKTYSIQFYQHPKFEFKQHALSQIWVVVCEIYMCTQKCQKHEQNQKELEKKGKKMCKEGGIKTDPRETKAGKKSGVSAGGKEVDKGKGCYLQITI